MPFDILEDEAPATPGGYEILGDEPAETSGTLEGIANSFKRGNLAGQRSIEALQFQTETPTIKQGRRAFVGAMEDPRYMEGLMGAEDPAKVESLFGPSARLKAAMGPAKASNVATAQNVGDLTKQANAIPSSAAMQEWSKADNSNWWQVFARNPVEITANIFAESIPQAATGMAAGMAAGAAGGPAGAAVGAGVGSFTVEAANAFLEAAAKSGVNLEDPAQVRAFFSDETKVKEAKRFAMQRGFPIALFDGLTAGVAGKFLKPALGKGMARVAGASAAELGTQMAGGALGETAAQVASGQEISAKDIAAEAIGELATAPGEVFSNLRSEARGFEVLPEDGNSQNSEKPKEPDAPVAVDDLKGLEAAIKGNQLKPKVESPSTNPSTKPNADALAELQAVLRGEAPGSQRLKGALPKVQPEPAGAVSSEPVVVEKRVEVPAALTEEQRAAIEFQRKTDEAVAAQVQNPDKNYEGMARDEVELLAGMGDARAIAERKKRNRAAQDKFLDSLAQPKVPEVAEYAGTLEQRGDQTLLEAAKEAGGVNAPPLEDALRRMEAGETPGQVVKQWAQGGGEADALINVLEQLREAARRGRQFKEFQGLAAAYKRAFVESRRNKTDATINGLAAAKLETGLQVKLPESTNDLIDRVWGEVTGSKAAPELSRAEQGLYFADVIATNQGRTKGQGGSDARSTESLQIGDKFRVRGEWAEVTGIDPDTEEVTITFEDGGQFGRKQSIDPQQVREFYPDFGTFRRKPEASQTKVEQGGTKSPFSIAAAPAGWAEVTDTPRSSVPVERVQALAQAFRRELPGAPEVVVLQTGGELPANILREARGGSPQAVMWHDGPDGPKVYVVADKMTGEERVRRVLAHEAVGHYGLRVVLGDQLNAFLDSVFDNYMATANGRAVLLEIAHRYRRQLEDSYAPTLADQRLIAEEIVAQVAEGEIQDAGLWGRIVAAVRRWWRQATGGDVTEQEIRDMLAKARTRLREGGTEAEGDGARFALGDEQVNISPKEFEKGWVHVNIRDQALDLSKPITGWVLPVEGSDSPNAMNTRYGKAGLSAVFVPDKWVSYGGDKPATIKPGFYAKPNQVAVIQPNQIRQNQTVDWAAVFGVGDGARFSLADDEASDTQRTSLRGQIEALGKEMDDFKTRGEAIPEAMLDEYKELVDTLGDEIRSGRANSGAGRVRVDENLEENNQEARTRRAIPQWKGAERLPGGRLKDLFTGLGAWRVKSGNWLARRGARETTVVNRDVADNRANQAANAASLRVRLILNRAFDTKPGQVRVKHEVREAALTFVVEADGERSRLADFYDQIGASEHADTKAGRQALAALEYAETNWDKLQPAAAEYKTLTETEREAELNEGVNSPEWKGGYVKHSWTRDDVGAGADPTKPAAAGTPFRKPRSVATYAEGIAQGRKPTTLNALELLADRVAGGQRKLNELAWVHGLRNLMDPVTDEPVVVDVIKKPRKPANLPPEGSDRAQALEDAGETYKPDWVTIAPEGYTVWRFGELEVAVQENFVGLLNKLTAASFFKGSSVKKVFGFIKSSLLMFDTFHLGRMVAWRQMFGLGGGYQKGQTLLDFSAADIREMAARGEIPAGWADGLLENKRRLDLALRTGFNVGNVLDNAWGDALHNLPVVGTFNHWLFGQYQRGAMTEAWLIEFERMSRALPNASEEQVARRVSKDLNARFGNLNRQGLFKSRTAQDLARFVFLAPQWNESLIRAELGAIVQTLKAPLESIQQRRLVVGTLMKATGAMALGTFLANQILNYAFRGKPTWENEEEGWDKKISAYLPDAVSGGPGFFLNPLALPMEYTHLIEGNLHRSGGDLSEALRRVAVSRLHAAARPAEMFLTRKDALGAKLRDGEVLPAMAKALLPIPIGAVSPATAAKQLISGEPSERFPGQYQKQMMASFGVKTDQAPSAEQRIRNLAREFNREKGIVPSAEFFTGDFDELNKALRIGNNTEARKALDELLLKKTPRQVYDHYKRAAAAPFTGQQAREKEFWRGLTEEQRSQYLKAREARKATAKKAAEMLKAVAKP